VLVAVDFNGTLSPFVLDPLQARAVPARPRSLAGCGCPRRRRRGYRVKARSRDACSEIGVKPNDFRTATLRSIGRAAWVR